MKEITLKIQDDHYKIIEKLAFLHEMCVEDFCIYAMKSGMTWILDTEVCNLMDDQDRGVHKLLEGIS